MIVTIKGSMNLENFEVKCGAKLSWEMHSWLFVVFLWLGPSMIMTFAPVPSYVPKTTSMSKVSPLFIELASPEYDVIVVGSGIGGLCAANILKHVYSKSVLVLESHYLPGGCAHSFSRGGHTFESGEVERGAKRRLDKRIGESNGGWSEATTRTAYHTASLQEIPSAHRFAPRTYRISP